MLSQVGVATIAMAVQRAGGSAQHPADALDEKLELMAAGIEFGARPEAGILGWASASQLSLVLP